jgi:betaine-aldehyde dehydrogenase
VHIRNRLFIDGQWVAPAGPEVINVINPMSEESIGCVPDGTTLDVDRAVSAARCSFESGPWRWAPACERSAVLERAADLLADRREEVSRLIIDENGSPRQFVNDIQVQTSIDLLRYYAQVGRDYPFEETRVSGTKKSLVICDPVGVVATIVPWNTPLRSTLLKVAPALAAGCSVIHKPDPATPLDSYILAEILAEAGLPNGVFNFVPGGQVVGEHLVSHSDVDKVAFTGSTITGKRIMSLCSERMARVSLELGGKSAAIILDDAPLEMTIRSLLPLSFMNSGQACVAQTRILVSRRRHDEFVDAFREAVGALTIGDPNEHSTFIGPLVTSRHRGRVEGYIATGLSEGAKVVAGGGRPKGQPRGWFVEPTVFVGVDNNMRIAQEEIFGPVVSVIPYDEVAEAVRLANASPYGLAGTVWCGDEATGLDVARRVRAGTYSVNGAAQADFTPYGGFKESGIGREACLETLQMYTEIRSIGIPS